MTIPLRVDFDALAPLTRRPASDVKKHGWRGLMRVLQSEGKLVVTNHSEPEAVILSIQDYAAFVRLAQQSEATADSALQTLRQRFDDRLAMLQAPDAGDRLRDVMAEPAHLQGRVKAGATF